LRGRRLLSLAIPNQATPVDFGYLGVCKQQLLLERVEALIV
jgi:hypothetical protein